MIARSFRSVIWVATVGGAALSCYMVSLRVATERADLAKVDRQIIAAKREIRSLQTELGTRGRMTQLEDWNANVLALSAPTSAQFVKDDVMLARLEKKQPNVEQRSADLRMASAETGAAAAPAAAAEAPRPTPHVVPAVVHTTPAPPAIHQASYTPTTKASPPQELAQPAAKRASKPVVQAKADAKPERQAKADAKPAPKSGTKSERQAKADARPKPEAKPERQAKADSKAPAKPASAKPPRDKKLAALATAVRHATQESDAD